MHIIFNDGGSDEDDEEGDDDNGDDDHQHHHNHHHHNHNDDRARPPWASARNWTRKSEPELFARFDTIRNFTPPLPAIHCLCMEIQRSTVNAMLLDTTNNFNHP